MTSCNFYVLSATYNDFMGQKSFESFAAARAFLRQILTNNIDNLAEINGYFAMVCAITN